MQAAAVHATLLDVAVLGEAGNQTGIAAELLPGQRMLLQVDAPLPQPIMHSAAKREYDNKDRRVLERLRAEAGGAPSKAASMARNWFEARSGLFPVRAV